MKINIKNFYCIETLIESNPEIIEFINIPNPKDKKISELAVNAKQSGIKILNKSKDFYAACKEPAVRDIKSANYEIGKSVLIFDEVQDTRNLGSCLRTASFFGINSVIIPKNYSADFNNPAVIETSTGGVYDLDLYKVANISQTISKLKENNYWVTGFSEHAKKDINTLVPSEKNVFVFGNEQKGIKQLVLKNCDEVLKIKQIGQTSSLNISIAAAIATYTLTNKI
mgnify:FL=1